MSSAADSIRSRRLCNQSVLRLRLNHVEVEALPQECSPKNGKPRRSTMDLDALAVAGLADFMSVALANLLRSQLLEASMRDASSLVWLAVPCRVLDRNRLFQNRAIERESS
jgi:hypothetical protein